MPSHDEIAFFARNGFVQIGKAVSETACEYLVAETWKRLPTTWLEGDPASWVGSITDSCHTADLIFRRGHLKFQKGSLLKDSVVGGAFGSGSDLERMVAALIGRPLASMRVRGLYPNVPPPDVAGLDRAINPHVEAHPVHVVAVAYLTDVAAGGGGLLVWPGSHRRLYSTFTSRLDFAATDEYSRVKGKFESLEPIELEGRRGDIILCHHRLFHAPSLNRSKRIRFAFFCDYLAQDHLDQVKKAPGPDIWEDWPTIRSLPAHERKALPDYQMLPSSKPRRVSGLYEQQSDSTLNKSDASRIVRLRRAAEIWLVISDSPEFRSSQKMHPSGSSLENVAVAVNGQPIRSVSANDIITPIQTTVGHNEIRVANIDRRLWIKLVEVGAPITQSRVIFTAEISGQTETECVIFSKGEPGSSQAQAN